MLLCLSLGAHLPKSQLALKSVSLCNEINYLSPSYTNTDPIYLSLKDPITNTDPPLSLSHKCRPILSHLHILHTETHSLSHTHTLQHTHTSPTSPPPTPPKDKNCQSTYPEPDGVGGDREPVPIMCDQQVGNRLWFTAFHRP